MTKRKLLKALRELQQLGDEEVAHQGADRLLLEFIDNPTIAKAFDDIEKWYA